MMKHKQEMFQKDQEYIENGVTINNNKNNTINKFYININSCLFV